MEQGRPVPGRGLYNTLTNNPAQGVHDLMNTLSASGQWFVHGNQVMFEFGGRLQPFTSERQVKALIANRTLPILNSEGNQVNTRKLCNESIPGLVFEHISMSNVDLPEIKRYVNLPAVKIMKGKLLACIPGYDASSGIYYQGTNAGLTAASPDCPYIRGWLQGLNFGNEYHNGNAIGITAACFARSAISEFPSIFIDANVQSSGKTKLAKAIGTVLIGRSPSTISYTGEQDELERRLSPFVGQPGPNYLLIDNVMRKGKQSSVASMMLSRSLDGNALAIRALYKGQAELQAPIFVLTMNDTTVHSDLQDKSVRIRLERTTREPNAELKPDPHRYALEHLAELRREFMYLLEGLPVNAQNHDTRCYEFNSIVYGVAQKLGLPVSLNARDVACPSDIVAELIFYTQDSESEIELGQCFSLQRLVDRVAARPDDFKELNRFLRACQRPHKQRGKELGKHLFHNAARPFLFEEDMYALDVSSDYNQATLTKITSES